ncbi:hypothetical protein HWV62_4844 [Athelia sp. TMB]|nr:hypothetical protein HWV62_4844 [Athelia sp. TMB]
MILATKKEEVDIDDITTKKEVRKYLIKWVGYSARENSWEDEENMQCTDRVNAFWKHIIETNVQPTLAGVSKADKAWIETQKISVSKKGQRRASGNGKRTRQSAPAQSSKRRKSADDETEHSYTEQSVSGATSPGTSTASTGSSQPRASTIRVQRRKSAPQLGQKPVTLRFRKRASKGSTERTPYPIPAPPETEAPFFRTPSPISALPETEFPLLRTPSPVSSPSETEPLFSRETSSAPSLPEAAPLPRPPRVPRPQKVIAPPRVRQSLIKPTAEIGGLDVNTQTATEIAPNISVFVPDEMQSVQDAMPELVPNAAQDIDSQDMSNCNPDEFWGSHTSPAELDDPQWQIENLFKSPEAVAIATTPLFDDFSMPSFDMNINPEDDFAAMYGELIRDPFADSGPPMQDYLPSEDPVAARETGPPAVSAVPETSPVINQNASELGGIVTFTVDALTECPMDCIELMHRLQIHPSWEFYVRPATLAAAAHALDKSIIDEIAQLIMDGAMSLLRAQTSAEEPLRIARFKWFYGADKFFSIKATLKACRAPLGADAEAVNADTARSLLAMQLEPAFSRDYARFVLVTGKSGANIETPGLTEVATAHRLMDEFHDYPDTTGLAWPTILLDADSDEE